METLMFIGRILFAAIFVLSGVNHFTKAEAMTGYVQFKGVPQPKLANLVSGALLVASGLSIILGIVADLGALVASILLVVMAVMMHDFWKQSDPQAQQTEMIGFMKNISMPAVASARPARTHHSAASTLAERSASHPIGAAN
mgnify:CR=1 FL=1